MASVVLDQVNKNLITLKLADKLMKTMEKKLKTHVSDKVSILQSTVNSKARGLRTFVVDVACSLGQRLSILETNAHPTPQAPMQATDREDHDAEVEVRLLKLENPNNMSIFMGTDALSRLLLPRIKKAWQPSWKLKLKSN
jgi:hypothetical protein